MGTSSATTTKVFKTKLLTYKQAIDADIAHYAKEVRTNAAHNFGARSRIATDAYLSILERGGKRIRGALTMLGYEMSGGKDQRMILKAARAIEMIHAYILIIDDINDRSPVRRGGPTAHYLLADYYKRQNLGDDAQHFGESIAMNAALMGNHAAQMILANLEADNQLVLNAISIINRSMVITAHGQFNDIFNEVLVDVREEDVNKVDEWKTAHYSFLNPLHVGMVLAGADCHATDGITNYAMQAGKAYQITDDILGTFGEEFESGKSPLDDLREGKRTILTVYALEHARQSDKNFLIQMLGNHNLSPVEFQRCKDILVDSGALTHAQDLARTYVEQAIASLRQQKQGWSKDGTQFLIGLAEYLLSRTS
ncbi:MAG: Polyprenyl synthetase [Candidatus Saccharibacteria bacterium]|nr:Polyprenyl synthetase [Candidatus Saccharibacteria bacterium]